MAIKWIPSAWRTYLEQTFPQDRRVYIDFRQQQYPQVAGAATYALVAAADNQPGSHYLTSSYSAYFCDMASTMTIAVRVKPSFAFNVASDQAICAWYNTASSLLSLSYAAADDKYTLTWQDAGTARTMKSAAYTTTTALQAWTDISAVLTLSASSATASKFYLDGAEIASAFSGAIDVKASNFPKMEIRAMNATVGSYDINYARLFKNVAASAAQVANDFSGMLNEEIVWHLNGNPLGHTRCNVAARVRSVDIERSVASPIGAANANYASVQLMSPDGQFADDQYAAFVATSEIYNGTSAQKYMQQRCPIEIETWYGGVYETEFIGRLDDNMFKRRSSFNSISMVTIGAYDLVDDFKRRVRQKAYSFENYSLCDPSNTASSLVHTIGNMQMQTEWYNFLANSSFENTTAANSWVVAGAGGTLTRAAGGLLGSYQGDLLCTTSTTCTQKVSFAGSKVLNVGQNWTIYLYGKSATGITATLSLSELTSGSTSITSASTVQAFTAGANWQRMEKTIAISTSATGILQARVALASAATFSMDVANLVQCDSSLNFNITNTTDGAAGLFSADSALSAVYSIAGFDVDDGMITHPWAIVDQGVSVWDYMGQIADATAARYMGMDSCGTLKYRTPFKAGYADPSSLLTVSSTQSVDTILTVEQANKMLIHGIKIMKDANPTMLWSAEKSSFFDRDAGGHIYETVATSATWPPAATYGEFWAKYDSTMNEAAIGIFSGRPPGAK